MAKCGNLQSNLEGRVEKGGKSSISRWDMDSFIFVGMGRVEDCKHLKEKHQKKTTLQGTNPWDPPWKKENHRFKGIWTRSQEGIFVDSFLLMNLLLFFLLDPDFTMGFIHTQI